MRIVYTHHGSIDSNGSWRDSIIWLKRRANMGWSTLVKMAASVWIFCGGKRSDKPKANESVTFTMWRIGSSRHLFHFTCSTGAWRGRDSIYPQQRFTPVYVKEQIFPSLKTKQKISEVTCKFVEPPIYKTSWERCRPNSQSTTNDSTSHESKHSTSREYF